MSPTSSQLAWSDIPTYIWSLYLRYLVHYEPKSWVATIAYTARVLAFLLIAPLAALTILDIASYVIARTLGIVDDVKASTSDGITTKPSPDGGESDTGGTSTPQSSTVAQHSEESSSDNNIYLKVPSTISSSSAKHRKQQRQQQQPTLSSSSSTSTATDSATHAYFVSDDHADNLRLSGVDVLSPATSRPPSPVTTKKARPEAAGQNGYFADGGLSFTPDVIFEEDTGPSIRRRGVVSGNRDEKGTGP